MPFLSRTLATTTPDAPAAGGRSAIEALLDLDTLSLTDNAAVTFANPMPAWVWALAIIAVFGVSVWSYTRLSGPRWPRLSLASLRTLLITAVLVLIAGPQLAERVDTVERDWVVVLVDRSASLAVADAPTPDGQRITRDEQLRAALESAAPALAVLAERREVLYLGFDRDARALAPGETEGGGRYEFEDADGLRTSFGAAFDEAVERTAARPVAGIVLISDGRASDDPTRAAWRALRAERVPVFTVPLGSPEPVGDLAIARVEAPPSAFVNDGVPVRVRVEALGEGDESDGGGGDGGGGFTLRLVNEETGEVIDERTVTGEEFALAGGAEDFTLRAASGDAGDRRLTVEIVPDGEDLVPGNNAQDIAVAYTARDLRVLFIDGYPRWEQRYLRQLLIREGSIDASTLILAPDRRFLQEGDTLIDALPTDLEGWADYDVIMLGDVSPDVFTREQLESLREHVATRGAGLVIAGGPGAMPRAWFDSPLAELLPFNRSAGAGTPIAGSALMAPTDAARRLALLRLNPPGDPDPWPDELETADTGWSLLRYVQRLEPTALKPATRTLANAEPVLGGDPTPAVLTMRFGAGRVVYVATDETWRWRFGRGETLFERIWVQLLRALGRERLERSGAPVVLRATPERATVAQPVRVAVELVDQVLIDRAGDAVRVTVRPEDAPNASSAAAPVALTRDASTPGLYTGVWTPSATGAFVLQLDAADAAALQVDGVGPAALVRVALPDDELRAPAADHDRLRAMATETDGVLLEPENLADLPTLLPNRERRQSFERTEPLWDTPLALIVILLLGGAEWIGRRLVRLT